MKIKQLRKREGLSQKELADKLCCSQVAYSRYECGVREPSIEMLKKMSVLFDESIDYIVDNHKKIELTEEERALIRAARRADTRARKDALDILEKHGAENI